MLDNPSSKPDIHRYGPSRHMLPFFLCFSLSLIGIALADYMLLNQDMAGIMAIAYEVMKGKHLYTDIITSQFPLIIYLSFIPLWIHSAIRIPVAEAFLVFTFFLLQVCILLGWRIAKRNALLRTRGERYAILTAFYYGLFILPMEGTVFISNFGQREHLFCALILPYIMLAINRVQGNEGSWWEKTAAGILGAVGFGIKPHFMLLFVFSEIFLMIIRRRFMTWNRIDAWLIFLLSATYYSLVLLFTPEYFALAPKFMFNYKGYEATWPGIFSYVAISFLLPLYTVIRLRRSDAFRILLFLLTLTGGGEIVYAVAKVTYFYHFIPVYFFSLILFVMAMLALRKTFSAFMVMPLFFVYISLQTTLPDPHYIMGRRNEMFEEAQIMAPYKKVAFFNTDMQAFPLVVYSGARWGMSVPYFDYLPTTYIHWRDAPTEPVYHTLKNQEENEHFFYEKIIKDLQNLPDAIVIFESPRYYGYIKFNFLHYLMPDPRFRALWEHYELLTCFPRKYNNFMMTPHTYDAIYRRKY